MSARKRWIPATQVCEVSVGVPAGPCSTPTASEAAFRAAHDHTDMREVFKVMPVSVRNRPLAIEAISVGCLTTSLVHPREVFTVALKYHAASVVLSHNHPSGDPEPSADDLSLTRRLVSAGTLLGIQVLDHIILGSEGKWVSLKERGVL